LTRRRSDVVTRSPEETLAYGRELALWASPVSPFLILLLGELGTGKTVLTKGIVAGLGAAGEREVTSPTFALVHEYSGKRKVYHLDLYRVEGLRDLSTLGLEEMLSEDATVIVEWGEKFEGRAPRPRLEVRLYHRGDGLRRIAVDEVLGGESPSL
jgi:tRNA threonylcarbamoyladenosine biosynthesis protein TsaE